ncbi:MAG: FAD-dependent oxidoreductase [Bacteroidota bacterium]
MRVRLYKSTSIDTINAKEQYVKDSKGITHFYDRLILATGSRPFVPRDVPLHIEGVFTIRHRENADHLKAYLDKTGIPANEQQVIIVGGGLLGLEIAAALRKVGINIILVQRAARLMERQLDIIASKLLAEDVIERDIPIFFNNEISTIFKEEDKLSVALKSGRTLQTHAVVYAIGTRPNIELAKEAGLATSRGVQVNHYLQTSDSNIFAVGEIAEFQQKLYGITAAAEQQADCAARYLTGDLTSIYQGSTLMNILKFDDLDLCSIGEVNVPKDDDSYEEVVFTDLRERYYKKCIIKNDLLVGAVLMGDKTEFAEFRALIENRIELSDKRSELLRGENTKEPVLGKLVCSCNNVGVGNIEAKIKSGCHEFRALCSTTGAGLGCGSCKPEVRAILNDSLELV